MVGRKVGQGVQLVRPAASGWQIWAKSTESDPWSLETETDLEKLTVENDAYIGIPARLVIAAPLWLPVAEDSTMVEMARMELDIRGLIPKLGEEILDVQVLARFPERMLVRAQIFPVLLPDFFLKSGKASLNASPLFAKLNADSVHLWKEGTDVAAVFTYQDQIVYWETAPATSSGIELSFWLERIGLTLQEEGVVASQLGFANSLPTQLPLPSFCKMEVATQGVMPLPAPLLPDCGWKSPQRREWERSGKKRNRQLRVGLLASGCYFALLAGFGGWIGWQHWVVLSLREQIRKVEPEALALRQADRQWNQLSGTVELTAFPTEILYRMVEQMPAEGIRLTQFDFELPKVEVLGEAKSASAAAQFFERLTKAKSLSHIAWEMPPPALLPNNTARFVITGAFNHAEN